MTAFQQLQVWFFRASLTHRVLVLAAVILLAGSVTWVSAPVGHEDGKVATTFGQSPSDSVESSAQPGDGQAAEVTQPTTVGTTGAATDGAATAPAGDTQPGPTAPGTAAPGTAQTRCPTGNDGGSTDSSVRIAITIINIAGAAGNQTAGVPTPEKQRLYWQAVADSINANGGAGCRKMALEFYSVNPIDANDAQQKCLAIAKSGPFITVDTGSLSVVGASDCIANAKIPLVTSRLSVEQMKTYYPYYLSYGGAFDDLIRNGHLAFAKMGYYGAGKGFEKLGFVFNSCTKSKVEVARKALAEAGVPGSSIVEFDMGCAFGQNSPVNFQQAVLTFKNAGVSHVTAVEVHDFATFTSSASQQNFKPQYVLADDAFANVGESGATLQPDAANLDGALNVISSRYGEALTPGFQPSGATQRCNEIYAAKGEPPVYKQPTGYGGVACDALWFVQLMLNAAPVMQRSAMAQAMHGIGLMDQSYPFGPVDFGRVPQGTPYGKPSWRPVQFRQACRCFQLLQPNFNPSF